MADVTYRFTGIPYGVDASVEDVTAPGVEVDSITGLIGGYADVSLPVGDYVAIFRDQGQTHRVAGDLASSADTDYARSPAAAGNVSYDNTTSELTATDVQAALDEIVARVAALET